MALRHFCLQLYCSHPITQNLLCRSRQARRHSIQHVKFHQPFWSWWPWVTSVTFRGQEVTFPYCSHPITQDLLRRSRRARRHSIHRRWFHQPFLSWWPWVTSVTFRGQKVTFAYGSHPITQDLLSRSRRAWRHSNQRMRFHQPFRSWWPSVTSVTFRGQKVTFAYGSHPITKHLRGRSRHARRHSILRMRFHQPFRSWWPSVTSVTLRGQKVTFAYGSHPIIKHLTGPIATSSKSFDSAYAFSSADRSWWTWVTSVTFRGQKVIFPYGSHPITQHLLGQSRRTWRHSTQRMRFHQPFRSWWPWVTSVTFRGQKVIFPYGNHPITQHLLDRSRRARRHSIWRMRFDQPFRSWWPWVTSVTFRGQKVTFQLWWGRRSFAPGHTNGESLARDSQENARIRGWQAYWNAIPSKI